MLLVCSEKAAAKVDIAKMALRAKEMPKAGVKPCHTIFLIFFYAAHLGLSGVWKSLVGL